jgi:hypothetical protein
MSIVKVPKNLNGFVSISYKDNVICGLDAAPLLVMSNICTALGRNNTADERGVAALQVSLYRIETACVL